MSYAGERGELKGFDVEEEQKGLFGRIKKQANDLTAMKAKYAKAETNINKIVDSLEKHQVTLMKSEPLLMSKFPSTPAWKSQWSSQMCWDSWNTRLSFPSMS